MKKIAINQSNYIPWRGYFDLINSVDEFIFFDEVQYTRRDWRNRNKILNNKKAEWITIALKKKKFKSKICNQEVYDKNWVSEHLELIRRSYCKAKFFNLIFPKLINIYNQIDSFFLSDINQHIIIEICNLLKINTKFIKSSSFYLKKKTINANDRLIDIILKTKGLVYFTGPSAKNYIDMEKFKVNNISVKFFNYGESKKYEQLESVFVDNLSIVDSLMHCGLDGYKFLNTKN